MRQSASRPMRHPCPSRWVPAIVALALALCLAPCHGQWTLLGYILGDNDLECEAVNNMQDMARALTNVAPGSIDVFLNVDRRTGLCAGSRGVDLPTSTWTTDKDIVLRPGGQWAVVQDYGEVNQATIQGLSTFVARGLARYPPSATRKYMMLIWDHGAAYEGIGMDVSCTASAGFQSAAAPTKACGWLMMDNIVTGLKAGLAAGGLASFDLVAFDACLMGNWEVAVTMAPVTPLILASEQLEPGSGLNYSTLAYMAANPTASALSVARQWGQDYLPSCMAVFGAGCTMAAISTGAPLSTLTSKLSFLATFWSTDIRSVNTFASFMMRAGLSAQRVTKDFNSVVDLADFMLQLQSALLASYSNVTQAQQMHAQRLAAINDVLTALNQTILAYSVGNAPRLSGLSIFWPMTSADGALASPFLSPIAQATPTVGQWLSLSSQVLTTAQTLKAPFQSAMAAAAPFLTTVAADPVNGGLFATASVPSPVIMTGDLQVGFMQYSDSTSIASPMRILRALTANVSSNLRTLSATWDGNIFGISQTIVDPTTGATTRIRAPLYTEESVTRDPVTGAVRTRIIQAAVAFADSCSSTVDAFYAGTLQAYVVYPQGGNGQPSVTWNLFVSTSQGNFGTAGSTPGSPADPIILSSVPTASLDPLTTSVVQSLGFTPKQVKVESSELLAAGRRLHGHDDNSGANPVGEWAYQHGSALAHARRAAREEGKAQRRFLTSRTTLLPADWRTSGSLPWSTGAQGPAAGPQPSQATGTRGPSSLLQYFSGSAFAEVSRSLGGYIIPMYFNAYRMNNVSASGGAVVYTRSFAESACFKWGSQYASNFTLVEDSLNNWSGTMGLRSPASQSWALRFAAVDLGGSLLQTETALASTSTISQIRQIRGNQRFRTVAGCTCMAQWYTSNGTSMRGCGLQPDWGAPGCQVVPGSCRAGATLAYSTTHDACAPVTTVSGCSCLSVWGIGNATRSGTCQPADADHPLASWCPVDSRSCASGSIRAGAFWDYCALPTATPGCECANEWVDISGVTYTGTCAVRTDALTGQTQAWCPTNQVLEYNQRCPLLWDTCTPPAGRVAYTQAGRVSQCVLPSLINQPAALTPANAVPASASQPGMYNCLTYNISNPSPVATPWCYINANGTALPGQTVNASAPLVQATCVPSGCAEPLIWACQQRSTNPTPTEVFECFREICRARVRGGQFTPVACRDPADTRSQLSIANMTYFNYATAKINATDSRNPFLVNAFPGMPSTAMEYCTAVYGNPCGSLLAAYCPFSIAMTIGGSLTFIPDQRSCLPSCLVGTGLVMERLRAGGGTGGSGCADAAAVLPLVLQLQAWLDTKCSAEPSNLLYTVLTVDRSNTGVCPSYSEDESTYLSGPMGVISSVVNTVGLYGSAGKGPLSAADLSNLNATVQSAILRGVQAVTGNTATPYPPGQQCVWSIIPANYKNRYIRLEVVFLSTELSYDTVLIYSADGTQNSLSGRLTPQTITIASGSSTVTASLPGVGTTVTTDSGGVLVGFVTDMTVQGTGFLIKYTAQDTPFVSVPTCAAGERLVSIFTTLTGLAGAASWALVPSTAPCPNPSASVTQFGLSTDGTSPARVIAAGGPAPSAALGPASAAVSASFPAGAVSFAQYREQTAYACVAPGTYKLLRFDSSGSGAWAPGSLGVQTADAVLLGLSASTFNGNGTQGSSIQPIYELCDAFVVPSLPAGVVDAPAVRAQGAGGYQYTVTLQGVDSTELSYGYEMIRLAGAIAKCANIPDTRVTFTNLPATNTNGRRMLSPLLGASQPSAPAKPRHPISRAFTDRTHNERKLQELRSTLPEGDRASMPVTPILMHESEVARVGIGHSDVGSLLETRVQERHMQGSTTSATVIFQVDGFLSVQAARRSATALDTSVQSGQFLAALQSAGLDTIAGARGRVSVAPSGPSDGTDEPGSGGGLGMGAMIGIAVGVVVGVALAVLAVLVVISRKRRATMPVGGYTGDYNSPAAQVPPQPYPMVNAHVNKADTNQKLNTLAQPRAEDDGYRIGVGQQQQQLAADAPPAAERTSTLPPVQGSGKNRIVPV